MVFISAGAFNFFIIYSLKALLATKYKESYGDWGSLSYSTDRSLLLDSIIITEQVKTLRQKVF